MPPAITQAIADRILVLDGGMGTAVQGRALDVAGDYLGRENCVDLLVRGCPALVHDIHASFLAAGSDAVETNTFGANRIVLGEFDDECATWARELNAEAASIARTACEEAGGQRFVLGSMGPGTKLISLSQVSWDAMLGSYCEQATGLLEGGVDAFLVETCQDLLQAKCAICACMDALAQAGRSVDDVPIMVSITIETTGAMLLGSNLEAVANALRPFPIASLGLNCATGPAEMADHVAWLSRHWDRPISVVPNAGLPTLVDGQAAFPLGPAEFAESMARFVTEHGVQIVGGCCGTTPQHIAALREALGDASPVDRSVTEPAPGCSSLYTSVDYLQDASLLIVAERTNANGSRKFRELLDREDWEGMVSMAREELDGGAHLLDICVDYVGREGEVDMAELAARCARQVDAPIMLDSTQVETIEAGLKHAGGRCIVNSINLEDGERRFDDICPLLARFGAAAVALTIDEEGMARTAKTKVAVAQRMCDLYVEKWGLQACDLLIDPLTFTICTGAEADRRLALETLEGIERIAEALPECGIILGVSNVSFGLAAPARRILNSAFLAEAQQRGLTAAIVHASKILPRNRVADDLWDAALWLIHDRRGEDRPEGKGEDFDPLVHYLELFEDHEEAPQEDTSALPLPQRLARHIIDGRRDGLEDALDEALTQWPAVEIINNHLLVGMKEVGELFGSGRMQLPFVLQSAEVMKKAVKHLEPHMEVGDASGRGCVVLATVAGDVHDIGKNLVDIILTNNGYNVINLGIRQPIASMVDALSEHDADAIGMSGLLVKSVGVMEENLKGLNERALKVPVLLGGAALTRHWAESRLRDLYGGPLYYGRDAFEALRVCDHLAEGDLSVIDAEVDARLAKRSEVEQRVAAGRRERIERGEGVATLAPALDVVDVPDAPFLGARIEEDLALDDIYPFINTVALFRGQWGFKRGALSSEEYEDLITGTVEPIYEELKARCREEAILRPRVAWGWWPCAADGDDLVIFDPEDADRQIERFSFPRQRKAQQRCISDFFRPIGDDVRDVIGCSCVTVGAEISRATRALFEDDRYSDYLYLHGIGVECAEGLAEYWHKRMRGELGIGGDDKPTPRELFAQGYRGSRYSFGYPACPEMSDQVKLFGLLDPSRIGCTLTENFEIVPEQSTSAIIVHHPQARYFNV